jgi:hypothetical protein
MSTPQLTRSVVPEPDERAAPFVLIGILVVIGWFFAVLAWFFWFRGYA